ATTADPATSAARLVGVEPDDVVTVAQDTSPAGRKTFALWEPPVVVGFDAASAAGPAEGHDDDPTVPTSVDAAPEHPRRSATAEAADLLADLVIAGARTLAFTRSRRGAESVAVQTQDSVRVVDPRLVRRVAAYRGGYLPEERRELEDAVRTGDVLGLATTNALELGVDISGLDAVLIAGWPGTRMSVWQQAGRAGRAG